MRDPMTRERRGRVPRIAVMALATAALLAGGTQMALADNGPSAIPAAQSSAKAPTTDGAKALCKRVPKLDRRIGKDLKRLEGDATVRGSVARLQARVDKAKSAGHSEIETYLNHRLTHRTSLETTLRQRQQDLASVATWCKNNNGATADQGTAS